MCKSFTTVGSLTPPLHLSSPLAPSCSFVLPASLIRVDDLNFGFLAQVFCVVEVGVSTSATAAALGEARGSPTEEGITLTVVHHMRIAQQDDLGICLKQIERKWGKRIKKAPSTRLMQEKDQ